MAGVGPLNVQGAGSESEKAPPPPGVELSPPHPVINMTRLKTTTPTSVPRTCIYPPCSVPGTLRAIAQHVTNACCMNHSALEKRARQLREESSPRHARLTSDYLIRLSPTARSTILSDVSPKLRRRLSRTEPLAGSTSVAWLFTQTGPAALSWVGSSSSTSAVLGGFCTCARRVWVMKLRGLEFS